MPKTVLILGATGRFGRHTAAAFEGRGHLVRRFRRGDDLMAATRDVDVIVYGWNPKYSDWARDVPGQVRQVIAAAKASGATVIIPGNVYVFGDGTGPSLGPDVPHLATNPLGRIRIEMERAFRLSGVRTIVLRCGDFLDTRPSGIWFDSVIAKGVNKGVFAYPGPTDRPHAWAYLPDVARAAVALAELDGVLPVFADIPFPGYTLTGEELRAACEVVTGRKQRFGRAPWFLIWAVRPVWPVARGIWEMRYLWSMPHHLQPEPLRKILPDFQATPLRHALGRALQVEVYPDQPVARGDTDNLGQIRV